MNRATKDIIAFTVGYVLEATGKYQSSKQIETLIREVAEEIEKKENPRDHLNRDRAYALTLADGVQITLDGEKAKITGARMDFATVVSYESNKRFEWAWDTIVRVLLKDGAFKS